jgi:hypothetical protein
MPDGEGQKGTIIGLFFALQNKIRKTNPDLRKIYKIMQKNLPIAKNKIHEQVF